MNGQDNKMPLMTRSWFMKDTTTSPTFQSYTLQAVSSTPPNARFNGQIVYYNSLIYLYGGEEDGAYDFDMWTFNPATTVWTKLTTSGTTPPGSIGCAMFVYNSKIYIYGGADSSGTPHSNTYSFNPTNNTWTSVPTTGAVARFNFAYSLDSNSSPTTLFIFGGYTNATGGTTRSIYSLALSTTQEFAWTLVSATGLPVAMVNCSAILLGSLIYMYSYSNTTLYSFNRTSISTVSVKNPASGPGNTIDYAISASGNYLYVYGGQTSTYVVSNSLFVYDTSGGLWSNPSNSFLSTGRMLAESTEGNVWYIFGGSNTNSDSVGGNYAITLGSTTPTATSLANPLPITIGSNSFIYGGITFTVFKDTYNSNYVTVRISVPINQPPGSIVLTSLLVNL